MFALLANIAIRRGWVIVLGWAVVVGALYRVAPPWDQVSKDDNVRFFPRNYPSVIGQGLLEEGFPSETASSHVVVVAERRDGRLTEADLAYVDALARALNQCREAFPGLNIKKLDTHHTPVLGPRLVGTAADGRGQAVLTIVHLKGTYLAKTTRLAVNWLLDFLARADGTAGLAHPAADEAQVRAILAALPRPPSGLTRSLTGSAVVGHDMNTASIRSVHNTTNATIALVVIILLVVYRSPLLALIPLVTIAISAWASLLAIASLTKVPALNFQVIDITNIFVIVVLFGAGTDYCLFLIARYREELVRGRDRVDALREAITQVGGALVASAGTVIIGLGMLHFSTFAKIQHTGPAIALALAVGLAAALTIAPLLLHVLRGTVFWPFQQPHHETGHDRERESIEQMPLSRFWMRVADLVVRHPLAILLVSVAALVPFAIVGAQTRSNYSQIADLGADQPCVIGASTVRRYFPLGELSPSSILVKHAGMNFLRDAEPEQDGEPLPGRKAIAEVSQRLRAIPNVAEVRSIAQPLGKPLATTGPVSFFDRLAARALNGPIVNARYVSLNPVDKADKAHITKIDVVFKTDPFSEASLESLEQVHDTVVAATHPGQPLAGANDVGLTGATAMVNDLKAVTTQDEHLMYWLVTLGVFGILLVLLRRPGVCLYLIATVVLGYLASLGLTEMVFKALHHGPEPWVGLDWKVGFFLFVILVAVGEDYNIFLMSRVIEEERKHGVVEGTRLAIAHTGGIISSCGLIMAGTFGSMLTGSLTALRELGFALGLGVLLDTFVVRPVLVPAFVVLADRLRAKPPAPATLDRPEKAKAMTSTAVP
jgi:RND superfamily putative drug exporter